MRITSWISYWLLLLFENGSIFRFHQSREVFIQHSSALSQNLHVYLVLVELVTSPIVKCLMRDNIRALKIVMCTVAIFRLLSHFGWANAWFRDRNFIVSRWIRVINPHVAHLWTAHLPNMTASIGIECWSRRRQIWRVIQQ